MARSVARAIGCTVGVATFSVSDERDTGVGRRGVARGCFGRSINLGLLSACGLGDDWYAGLAIGSCRWRALGALTLLSSTCSFVRAFTVFAFGLAALAVFPAEAASYG